MFHNPESEINIYCIIFAIKLHGKVGKINQADHRRLWTRRLLVFAFALCWKTEFFFSRHEDETITSEVLLTVLTYIKDKLRKQFSTDHLTFKVSFKSYSSTLLFFFKGQRNTTLHSWSHREFQDFSDLYFSSSSQFRQNLPQGMHQNDTFEYHTLLGWWTHKQRSISVRRRKKTTNHEICQRQQGWISSDWTSNNKVTEALPVTSLYLQSFQSN